MSIFKKAIKTTKELDEVIETTHINPTPSEEEWVWVEGYKGTDKNMCCLEFQYEMDKQFDILEDAKIEECKYGFHLCLTLNDVFKYYNVGDDHRFFKVKALVRKSDKEKYGENLYGYFLCTSKRDKLVAKSIIFLSELTVDEILEVAGGEDLPEQYKQLAIKGSIQYAYDTYHTDLLIEDGYSKPFTAHIVKNNLFDVAHAIGSQKDLSMDMKVLYILNK